MKSPKYTIKPNPQDRPVYPYAYTDHFLEITEGDLTGVQFNFILFHVTGDDNNKKLNFEYNLLFLPEGLTPDNEELEPVIGNILQQLIELGHYAFNTKL